MGEARLYSRAVHVEILVDQVTLGEDFLLVPRIFTVIIIPPRGLG